MEKYILGEYDVIVIGAGHAGIEAAHAAATLGVRTALFTLSLDAVGNLPCNPSIGGTAKGHLVREVDALGGVMGIAADATFLQSRMLNLGKGPAVHSLRVQTDRSRYHLYMKRLLENTENLEIKQAEITQIDTKNGAVCGVYTKLNGYYLAKKIIIATGTYLGGKIFVGEAAFASGPDGVSAANALTDSLRAAGVPIRRFKTGTPARVHRRSIDFSKLERQDGDESHPRSDRHGVSGGARRQDGIRMGRGPVRVVAEPHPRQMKKPELLKLRFFCRPRQRPTCPASMRWTSALPRSRRFRRTEMPPPPR